jgi:hypothetical protein
MTWEESWYLQGCPPARALPAGVTAREIATAFAAGEAGYRSTGGDIWYVPAPAGWYHIGEARQAEVSRLHRSATLEAIRRGSRGSCDSGDIVAVLRDETWDPDALPAHADLDGTWARLVEIAGAEGQGLEIRDPNSGQGRDPNSKPRLQYAVVSGRVVRRHLPPTSVGDVWADIGEPAWEPVSESAYRWGLLRHWATWALSRSAG